MTNYHKARAFFTGISQRLLRGGIAPRHTKRIVSELSDHYDDLRDQALENGASPEDATQEALSTLGREDDLVSEALSKPELRSWSSRWPWAIYGIAPIIVFFLGMLLLGVLLAQPVGRMGENAQIPAALKTFVETGVFFVEYLWPVLVILLFSHLAIKRQDSTKWSIFGPILLSVFAAGFHFQIGWPEAGLQGFISVSLGYLKPFPFGLNNLIKLLVDLSCVGIYLFWYRSSFMQFSE